MKQVVVYPTGFAGYDVGWPVIRTTPEVTAAQALARYGNTSTREKVVISNPQIELLYKQWRTKARRTSDAEFLSDIFAAVANAFGTNSFYEWCHLQLSNPYFTADHRQYLNETLYFLDGVPRSYSFATWAKMLTIRRATPEDAQEPYDYQEVMLRWGPLDSTSSILEVMERWVNRPNGVEDMLTFAHMVFGELN